MRFTAKIVLLLAAMLTLSGCDKHKKVVLAPATAHKAAQPATAAVQGAPAGPEQPQAKSPPADAPVPAVQRPAPATSSAAASNTSSTSDESDASSSEAARAAPAVEAGEKDDSSPAPVPQRIMLLAPGGPLLVDLLLTIDGRPHDEALAKVVEDALQQADADHDGRASWDEITQDPRLRYGEGGNLPARTDSQRKQLVRMYDMDRNGFAEPAEARRYLTRNSAASKAFNLRSSNYYRDANRWDSPIRTALDADNDGSLNQEEISQASSKLKYRDGDDDDVLLLEDFLEITPGDVGPLQQRRSAEAEAALHLTDVRDWNQVLYTLEELYAFGQLLTASSFNREPQLFAELDENSDGEIDQKEIPRLLQIAPHLVLEMPFGAAAKDEDPAVPAAAGPLLRLAAHPRDVPVEITELADRARLTCAWSDVTVVFFCRDAVVRDFVTEAKRQISIYDTNQDGYLESSEFSEPLANMLAEFSVLDSDMDQKIYPAELAQFQEKQQAPIRSQLRARAGEDRDALFAALDVDHDGRLTGREIASAAQHLAAMDRDQDQQVVVAELPTAMLLGVVRGSPELDAQLFQPPTAGERAAESSPEWFTSMDVNRDGEISRREFLGQLSLFDQLDADQDGFLNVSEAGK